ncbi:hypothetical protein Tco_0925338 [Tanacetum coccineum]|uniref:Uncharacterized protein n=1 Tax=Tanacetum coccineum TaxID=301880 RepID=A0ABQ5DCQ2_9ASTR
MTRVHQRNTPIWDFYTKTSSKEAQGLQGGGIAKLAIRVTYLNPRATIKDANSVGDLWLRLKERLRG